MGPRCEYKDLDGSYLRKYFTFLKKCNDRSTSLTFLLFSASQRRFMLETASIAGGAAIAVLLVVILCVVVYIQYKRKAKTTRTATDCVDGRSSSTIHTPTFGTRWRTNPPVDLPIRMHDRGDSKQNKIELHQVTTLLPSSNQP